MLRRTGSVDLLAMADMEAMMATVWMRQLRTSGGSCVPSACSEKPILADNYADRGETQMVMCNKRHSLLSTWQRVVTVLHKNLGKRIGAVKL